MVDFFIRLQIFYECLDNCPKYFFVGFVSGECLEEERNPVLVCRNPKNKSFEIPSAIFRMAVGDLDLSGIGVRFVFATYTKIRGVNMDAMRAKFGRKQTLIYDLIK